MQNLNYFMSKRRRFHISILGDSLDECIKFYEELSKLSNVKFSTITTSIRADEKGYKGNFICKSSTNYKKFNKELKKFILEYK